MRQSLLCTFLELAENIWQSKLCFRVLYFSHVDFPNMGVAFVLIGITHDMVA